MNIGLVAHDAKKKLMQNFCIAYRGMLGKNTLYATGTTGRLMCINILPVIWAGNSRWLLRLTTMR